MEEDDHPISVSASVEVWNHHGHAHVFSLEEPNLETQTKAYVEAIPSAEQKEANPEYPNLGVSGNEKESSYIDSITVPQFGGETLFSSPVSHTPYLVDGLPMRMTICCNVPFHHGQNGPECSNPQCPEKRRREVQGDS